MCFIVVAMKYFLHSSTDLQRTYISNLRIRVLVFVGCCCSVVFVVVFFFLNRNSEKCVLANFGICKYVNLQLQGGVS